MRSDERVSSGIPGLDKLIEGGYVKGSTNLVSGSTGTGKSTFCCQFILEGLKKGEKCLYVTLEQGVDEILSDVSRFSWGEAFKKYVSEKKLTIVYTFPTNISELKEYISNLLEKTGAKRFVMDSLTLATVGWKDSDRSISTVRRGVYDLLSVVKKAGVTSLLISEIPEDKEKQLSSYGFEEFLVDGVIVLHYLEYAAGGIPRSLIIRKMRRTNHGIDIYPIQINKNGILVKKI